MPDFVHRSERMTTARSVIWADFRDAGGAGAFFPDQDVMKLLARSLA
jgi:hypothetical protein